MILTLPPRDRLLWEDSEVIRREEDWVDTTLHVRNRGEALYLRVEGRAQVDFAEIYFENGEVQVVDFREERIEDGSYRLLDFPGVRNVDEVRVVARALSDRAKLTLFLRK